MGKRPNILLITSDQQRGDCLGCEGRGVKTPHIDLLAEQGTRFSACITPNNVCQPTRASILTGPPAAHPRRCRQRARPAAGDGRAGVRRAAGRTGYRSALIGKPHFATSHTFAPTGTPECRGSMHLWGEDWNGPYMGFDHVELMIEGPQPVAAGEAARRPALRALVLPGRAGDREEPPVLRPMSAPTRMARRRPGIRGLPVAWHNSTWIGDRTVAWLKDQRRRATEAVLLWVVVSRPAPPVRLPRSRGVACTTRTRSTCRSTARSISSGGRGGTARRSRASRRSAKTWPRSASSIQPRPPAERRRSCARSSPTPMACWR